MLANWPPFSLFQVQTFGRRVGGLFVIPFQLRAVIRLQAFDRRQLAANGMDCKYASPIRAADGKYKRPALAFSIIPP